MTSGSGVEPDRKRARAAAHAESGASTDGPRGTVLIVDDDQTIRALVRMVLGDEGYLTAEAADGSAALALVARDSSIDLILLDLSMPVMDGWQFATAYQALKLAWPHPPVVVVTGKGAVAPRLQDLNAVGFLAKPFDLDELIAAVGKYPRRRPDPKLAREHAARQLDAAAQQARLERLRHDLDRVRGDVATIAVLEAARPLTRDEARQASHLRAESERLRDDLDALRSDFSRLRDERPPRDT